MTQQHTPGPWAAEYDEGEEYGDAIVSCRDGCSTIAAVHNHASTSTEHGADECRANARLIAAAPDMLKELETSEEAWLAIGRALMSADPVAGRAIIAVRIKETRAIIAKARGE